MCIVLPPNWAIGWPSLLGPRRYDRSRRRLRGKFFSNLAAATNLRERPMRTILRRPASWKKRVSSLKAVCGKNVIKGGEVLDSLLYAKVRGD